MDKRLISLTFSDVVREFVDTDVMEKVCKTLSDCEISIGVAHHSLGALLVDDLVKNSSSLEEAMTALISFEHFMYQLMAQMAHDKFSEKEMH